MTPPPPARQSNVLYLLAGLETGVLGGLAALGWFAVGAVLSGRSIWSVPLLLGSLLYEEPVYGRDFGRVALAGIALQVFATGLLGALFGLAARQSARLRRTALLGLAAGLVWYFVFAALIFRKWGGILSAVRIELPLLVGGLIYGAFLMRYRGLLRRLEEGFRAAE